VKSANLPDLIDWLLVGWIRSVSWSLHALSMMFADLVTINHVRTAIWPSESRERR
jgi:hypothetical protein